MTSDEEKQYRKSAKRITNRIGKYIDETFGVSAPKIKTNKQMTPNGTPGIKSKRMTRGKPKKPKDVDIKKIVKILHNEGEFLKSIRKVAHWKWRNPINTGDKK